MTTKRKPRRHSVKNPSLKKNYNSKIRQEYLDLDYVHKLDDKKKSCRLPDGTMVTELEYMAIFMKEWNSAGVGKQSEAENNKFHRTAKEVKECTDRNNHRNADEYGRAKAQGLVHKQDYETLKEFIEKTQPINPNSTEDSLIEFLDSAKELGKSGNDTKK